MIFQERKRNVEVVLPDGKCTTCSVYFSLPVSAVINDLAKLLDLDPTLYSMQFSDDRGRQGNPSPASIRLSNACGSTVTLVPWGSLRDQRVPYDKAQLSLVVNTRQERVMSIDTDGISS